MKDFDNDSTPCTVAPGYEGDPKQWCWWYTEYPDEGSIGPFDSADEAKEGVAFAAEDSGTPMHVEKVLTFEEANAIFK